MTDVQPDNGVQAAIDAGMGLAEPYALGNDGRFYSVTTPAGAEHCVIDLEQHLEAFRDKPRRKTGVFVVHETASFVTYLTKHGLPHSEVYADLEKSRITGVINAHDASTSEAEGDAGHGDHRVVLELQLTPEWQIWRQYDRQMMPQVAFAEHIEARLEDIQNPPAAEMLEVAQSLSVKRDVSFESTQRLATGERRLQYRENDDAKAGKRGDLAIPEQFMVGLRVFEGGTAYGVNARLRYRIDEGHLQLGYVLDRPEEVARSAFLDVRTTIGDATGYDVLAGRVSEPSRLFGR